MGDVDLSGEKPLGLWKNTARDPAGVSPSAGVAGCRTAAIGGRTSHISIYPAEAVHGDRWKLLPSASSHAISGAASLVKFYGFAVRANPSLRRSIAQSSRVSAHEHMAAHQ